MKIIFGRENPNSSIDGDPYNFTELLYRREEEKPTKRAVYCSDFLADGIIINYEPEQKF